MSSDLSPNFGLPFGVGSYWQWLISTESCDGLTRARQRAGFFRVGLTRPGFPGFGPASGLRIRKSGFRAGFQVRPALFPNSWFRPCSATFGYLIAIVLSLLNFSPGRKNPGFGNPGRKFPGRVARPVAEPWVKHGKQSAR